MSLYIPQNSNHGFSVSLYPSLSIFAATWFFLFKDKKYWLIFQNVKLNNVCQNMVMLKYFFTETHTDISTEISLHPEDGWAYVAYVPWCFRKLLFKHRKRQYNTTEKTLKKWENEPLRSTINTLRPRQNGSHFPGGMLKRIFLNECSCILMKFSLKFASEGHSTPQCDKPSSELILACLPMHICDIRPQRANSTCQRKIVSVNLDD